MIYLFQPAGKADHAVLPYGVNASAVFADDRLRDGQADTVAALVDIMALVAAVEAVKELAVVRILALGIVV